MPRPLVLRASGLRSFKACPRRFQLATIEGLEPAQESDSARIGTVWHAMHEVYYRALEQAEQQGDAAPTEFAQNAAIDFLGERYAAVPHFKTPEEWALERTILSTCFVGYLWYFSEEPIDVLQSEFHWVLPLHNPMSGRACARTQVYREGTIDHLVQWRDMVGTIERKSTSKSIAPDSAYWNPMRKDTQVSMYALAMKDMESNGVGGLRAFGLDPVVVQALQDGKTWGNTLYDVWHRPTLKPAMLTQAETAEFITSGMYNGVEFQVSREGPTLLVNGQSIEEVVGKSGKPAILETLEMFAARLLTDITERPDYYFQRREISRTTQDLKAFRVELYNLFMSIRSARRLDSWFENEQQCQATYPCPFIPICYGEGGAAAVIESGDAPAGFVRCLDVTKPITEES